ncbi:hypothetical protein HMSSN036_13170 [Paenibacillus macerans]|nr:hypothetical protein HMSSN036_13170 [Paenibacillus macerans]
MELREAMDLTGRIRRNIGEVVVGKEEVVDLLLAALLGDGHVLLEDVPGTGKTLLAKALAKSLGGGFKRVQFTPDLLPSDLSGIHFSIRKRGSSSFARVRCLRTCCWRTRSTGRRRARNPACWNAWRSAR